MANFNIKSIVKSVMQQTIRGTVHLYGDSEIILQNNLLSWDGNKMYTFDQVNETFGRTTRAIDSFDEEMRIYCGKSTVSVYDFGLIYSAFCAIVMSGVELGGDVATEEIDSDINEVRTVWFNNDGVIYSKEKNLIIQVDNATAKNVASGKSARLTAFTQNQEYEISLSGGNFVVTRTDGSLLCSFVVPTSIKRNYRTYFGQVAEDDLARVGVESTSALGALINDVGASTSVSDIIARYALTSSVGQVVVRDDLIFVPQERYTSVDELFGSWAYTDTHDILMPVNSRNGMLVYSCIQELLANKEPEVYVVMNPKFQEFYNVTDEVYKITVFVKSIVNRPLTAAEMDNTMFVRIKDAFVNMQLGRLPLNAAFGRIVIPENVIEELGNTVGDRLYCIVPVGQIGDKILLLDSAGNIDLLEPVHWNPNEEYYYDITELVNTRVE